MKATTVFFAFLLVAALSSPAQSRKCATMEVQEQKVKDDPALRFRIDSMHHAMDALIKERGYSEDYSQLNLPLIPGFTPTGDPQTDVRNFAAAKKELYAKDPDLYRALTRKATPQNRKKTAK